MSIISLEKEIFELFRKKMQKNESIDSVLVDKLNELVNNLDDITDEKIIHMIKVSTGDGNED